MKILQFQQSAEKKILISTWKQKQRILWIQNVKCNQDHVLLVSTSHYTIFLHKHVSTQFHKKIIIFLKSWINIFSDNFIHNLQFNVKQSWAITIKPPELASALVNTAEQILQFLWSDSAMNNDCSRYKEWLQSTKKRGNRKGENIKICA